MFWVITFILVITIGVFYGLPLESEEESRIIGGVAAPDAYAPHMVALLRDSYRLNLVCGASIVSRTHVLTAAHCVTDFVNGDGLSTGFHGRVGSNVWHTGGIVVYFQGYHIHPEWDLKTIQNDVAILRLYKELELSDRVSIIGIYFGRIEGSESSSVTGWGNTGPRIEDNVVHLAPTPDQLQVLNVSTIKHAQCVKGIKEVESPHSPAPPLDPCTQICTYHSIGHGMCNGDSGSALVSLRSGLQIGLVSWGFACAIGAPDVFTRASGFEDFIRSIIEPDYQTQTIGIPSYDGVQPIQY